MTPEEFFAEMTRENCKVIGTLTCKDHPGEDLVVELPTPAHCEQFAATADVLVKLLMHGRDVKLIVSCQCGDLEPIEVPIGKART